MERNQVAWLVWLAGLGVWNAAYADLSGSLLSEPCLSLIRDEGKKSEAPLHERSVFRLGKVPGRFGGDSYLVECRKEGCLSDFATFRNAPQGNPRWIVTLLGEETAAFFGFRIVDERRMWVPSQAELSGAVEFFNRHRPRGIDPILLGFYSPPGTGIITPELYVRESREVLRFPIAPRGVTQIHDLSFHVPILILPASLLALIQSHSLRLLQLVDWLDSEGTTGELAKEALFDERVRDLDVGTGNFTIALAEHRDISFAFMALEKVARSFANPDVAVRTIADDAARRNPKVATLRALSERFVREVPLTTSAQSPSPTKEAICQAIGMRTRELRQTIAAFSTRGLLPPQDLEAERRLLEIKRGER